MIYRQQSNFKKLPSCSYTKENLVSLIMLFSNIHKECTKKLIAEIKDGLFNLQNLKNENNDEEIRSHTADNFKATLEIIGSEGEYINMDVNDIEELKDFELPNRIKIIKLNNSFAYEFGTKRKPSNYCNITIDFNEIKVFDLLTHASASTENDSSFEVTGIDSTFVNGVSIRIEKYFNNLKNYNSLINKQHAYDVLLWIGFLPLLIFYIIKYQHHLNFIAHSPIFLQVLLSVLLLLFSLLVFRNIFNIARWFFPCQELISQPRPIKKVLKYIFSISATGVIGTISYNVIVFIFEPIG